ncbi:MAG: acyl-CoA dehydratase activase [Thermoanaerobaculia bacterium]
MRALGFDIGSVYVKAVFIDDDGVRLSHYHKIGTGDAAALAAFFDAVAVAAPGEAFRVGLAAVASRGRKGDPVRTVNPIVAIAAAMRRIHPDARSVIEIGGHTSKFLVIAGGSARDFATNEACAAGTGSFLEQQARRLALTIEELSEASVEAKSAATIAGRCSVFAKSDMIHLQQKGTPVPEIAYGLCAAICRNAMTTLLKGRDAPVPLVIAGGCARNAGVVRAFREIVGAECQVSQYPGLEAAIGAAIGAAESANPNLPIDDVRRWFARTLGERDQRREALPPLSPSPDAHRRPEPQQTHHVPVTAYLGVDVGSVSTDLVLLDDEGRVISSLYLATRGRPVDVLLDGLEKLRARFPAGLQVAGCGATGSGRYLAARLLNADAVRNEITCQILGAQHFVPDADTIFEIGGQDSKFMSLRNGALADFAMNKVCAAGTGSFLEEQAREIGIEIERDFAARAFAAKEAVDLGTRCTVFIETEVVSALHGGATTEEICAGLAHAIVRNYLDKVVGGWKLGSTIVFQGGVASNDAVVAAFEQALGRAIHVHPFNRISGAIGAALAARDAVASAPSRFRSVARDEKPSFRSFECHHCSNRCEVNILTVGGERAFFGDTCERYTERTGEGRSINLPPNLAEEYVARCEAAFEGSGSSGLTIGIPRGSTLFESLPFWAAFFRALGHRPVLSDPSSDATLTLGLKHLSVGVCLPIKLTAGHVQALIRRGVDLVFLPSIVVLPGDDPTHAYSCPYAMAVPFIVSSKRETRLFSPVVSMQDVESFLDGFEPYAEMLGTNRMKLREAWEEGRRAEKAIDAEFRARASALMEDGGWSRAVAILGKPYNTFDGYLNLSLVERLRRLGVLAIPQKFLPETGGGSELPWRFSADMEMSAASLSGTEAIYPILVSNFGCGPDAFSFGQIEEALGAKPHLTLEFDEHRGEAGLITRLEAFLDQLDATPGESHAAVMREAAPVETVPPKGAVVRIPYFADHAHAFCGLLRLHGCDAAVLPPPGREIRALGERHSLGKECHAYSMLAGDLLELSRQSNGSEVSFFFPGTALPCLLHEYGNGMRRLLRELGIANIRVYTPNGAELAAPFSIDALERFYRGLLSIELLVKGVCEIRPYETVRGLTDAVHEENLRCIEEAIAEGDILEALDKALARLSLIPIRRSARRPVVGMAGDIYTKSNFVANDDLVRWLEDRGLEVWPSPFQIDMIDFGISRALSLSMEKLDLPALLRSGSLAANRAFQQWRVRRVVGDRVARASEPGYEEMKKLTAPYMSNDAHQLLFINIAKTVDFARNGADGIVNAICFNCMVGNASAAIIEKIRRDHDDIPIITAVYSGNDDPSRQLVLEAFVAEVTARAARRIELSAV